MANTKEEKATYEKKVTTLKDIEWGIAAAYFAQQGNGLGVDLALSKIRYDPEDPHHQVLQDMAGANDTNRKMAANLYHNVYTGIYESLNVSDLGNLYNAEIGNHSEIKEIFESEAYKGRTIFDVEKELHKAKEVLNNGRFYNEEEIKEAKETINKYNHFERATNILFGMKTSKMINEIEKEVAEKGLEAIINERKSAQ